MGAQPGSDREVDCRMSMLTHFAATRPRYEVSQAQSLAWLAAVHAEAEAAIAHLDPEARARFATRCANAIRHCACSPDKIGTRGHSVGDVGAPDIEGNLLYDVREHPHGKGSAARTRLFADIVDEYFERAYAEDEPPDDLIHVTCTGYVSPNGAQKLVARRGWGRTTRVTTAYHMGCYAAIAALRVASGFIATGSSRVDLAHTELCSLHLDPGEHSLEQLVVQSLFADGLIRYSMVADQPSRGLRLLAQREQIVPDSEDAMTWQVSDTGMQMTLSREVPERIEHALRGFIVELLASAGRDVRDLPGAVFAVHPGGPQIIDRVRGVLELDEAQVATSRRVLFEHGNMSSATLPHIWMRLLDDPEVAPGTRIPSLAFGPGLTVCGAVFVKQ
jgi:predicted naringenin-chalcone synthase